MVPFEITIDTKLMTARNANKASRMVMGLLGTKHLRERLPRHFQDAPETVPGGGGYRYRRRSKKWIEQKRKEGKPATANVYTGTLRDTVKRSSVLTNTATRWRIKAKLPVVYRKDASGKRLLRQNGTPVFDRVTPQWQRDEIEILSRAEVRQYAKDYRRFFRQIAKSPEFRRKRRVRGSGGE